MSGMWSSLFGKGSRSPSPNARGRSRRRSSSIDEGSPGVQLQWGGDGRSGLGKLSPRDWQLVQEMSVRRSRKLCTRAIISWSWSLQCRRRACAILETVADFSTTGDAFAAWREMVLGGGSVLHGEGDYDEMLRPASSSGSQVRGILRRTQLSSREGDTRGGWNGEDDEEPGLHVDVREMASEAQQMMIEILLRRVEDAGFERMSYSLAEYFLSRSRGRLEDALRMVARHATASDTYHENLAARSFNTWNIKMVRKAVIRAGMEAMLIIRVTKIRKECLESWRLAAQRKGLERNAREMHMIRLVGSVLSSWRKKARILGLARGMSALIRARAALHLYNKAFGGWFDETSNANFLREVGAHIKWVSWKRLLQECFERWKDVSKWKFALERMSRSVALDYSRKLTLSALVGWSMVSLSKIALKNVWHYFDEAFAVGTRRDVVRSWHSVMLLQRLGQKYLDEWHHDIKLDVLTGWLKRAQSVKTFVFFAVRERRIQELLAWRVAAQTSVWHRLILGKVQSSALVRGFREWNEISRYVRYLRSHCTVASSERLMKRVHRIVLRWFAFARYSKMCSEILQARTSLLRVKYQAKFLKAWCEWAEDKRFLSRAGKDLSISSTKRLQASVLRRMRMFGSNSLFLKGVKKRGVDRFRKIALCEWRDMHNEHRSLLLFTTKRADARANGLQSWALREWRDMSDDAIRLKCIASAVKIAQAKRLCAFFVRGVKLLVSRKKFMTVSEKRLAEKRHVLACRDVISSWRNVSSLKTIRRNVGLKVHRMCFARVMDALRWRVSLANLKQRAEDMALDSVVKTFFALFAGQVKVECTLHGFWNTAQRRILWKHLSLWVDVKESSRLVVHVASRISSRIKAVYYRQWVKWALSWGRGIIAFEERRTTLCLEDAFAEWQFVAMCQANINDKGKWLEESSRKNLMSKALNDWRGVVDFKFERQEMLTAMNDLREQELLDIAFREFLISAGEKMWFKECMEEISAKHSLAVCRTVWAAWLYGVEVQENANELLDKVLRRLGTNLVDEWMKVAITYRGHIRSTREKLNKSTMRLVFGSWRGYGAWQDSLWGAVEATVAGSMARSKGIIFASWRDHCKRMVNMSVRLQRAVETFSARRKRFAFVAWHRRMAKSVKLQAAYVAIENAQRKIRKSRAVKGWKYMAIELHVKLMTYGEKMRPLRITPVFRAWSIATKHAAYMRSPKGKSIIRSSLNEWARVSISWRRLVERGRRNGGKIARRLVFCAWKHECVTIPSTIASFAEKHRHAARMKKRIWAAWCKLVHVHEKFMRPLEDRKRRELLQDFLFMWRFIAEAQSNLARAGQVLEEQTMEDLTAFAFFEWSTLTSQRMETLLLIQRVSNLRETEILEKCFAALAEHAAFQKFLADTEDKIAGPRESGFLLRAFREWMRVVTAKRSKERLIKAFRNKTIQRERAQTAVATARRTSIASVDSQCSPCSPTSPVRSPNRLSPSSSFRNLDLMGLERPRLNSASSFKDLNLALQNRLLSSTAMQRTPSFARTSSFQRASSFARTSSLGMGVRSTVVTRLLVRSDAGLKQQAFLCWQAVVQRRQYLSKFESTVNERFLRSFFFVWVLVSFIQPRKIKINLVRMDRRIKCGAFYGWKLVSVTYGARLRSFGERHQVRKRLIRIHLASWALFVSVTRRVNFIMEDNLMAKAYKEWSRVTVVRHAQIAMGRRLIRSNLLGRLLRAWKWVAITLKWKVIDHQERHWPHHVAPMFQAWRILARFDKNFRGASDKISARRSFYEWARVSVLRRRLVERGRKNGNTIACKLVFSAWKHECVTIPECIRLFGETHKYNFGQMRKAMDAWIISVFLYAASLKQYGKKIRKASLAFALNAWREETNEMSHLARAGAAVTEIILDNLAMFVLFEWATYTVWKRETLLLIQRVSNLRETEILEKCFAALAEHAAFQKFLADTEDKIAGPRESGFLLRAFREWMRVVTAKRSKERLIKAFRNKTIQRERAQKAVGLARLSSNASHHSPDRNSPHPRSPTSPVRSPNRLSPSSSFRNLDLMGLERPRLNSASSFKDLNLALQNRLLSSTAMQRTPSFARTSSFQRASSFARTSSLGMGVRSTVVTRLLVRSDAGLKQQAFLCWQAVVTRIHLVAGFESKVLDHLLSNIFAEWVHHRSVCILVERRLERKRAVCLQQWFLVAVVYNRRIETFQKARRYWERCISSALSGWRIFVRFSVYFSGPRDETLVRSSFRFWASKVQNVRALKQGRSSAEFSRTTSAITRTTSSLPYSTASRTPSAISSSIPSPRMSSDRLPRFVAQSRHLQHAPPRSASTNEDQGNSMSFLTGPEPHFSRSATSSSPMTGASFGRPSVSVPLHLPESSTFGITMSPASLSLPPSCPGLPTPSPSRNSKMQSSTGTAPPSTEVPSPSAASLLHPVVHMLKSDSSPRRQPDATPQSHVGSSAFSRSFSVEIENQRKMSESGMSGSPRGFDWRTESAAVEGYESPQAGSRELADSPRSFGWSRTGSFHKTQSFDAAAGNERLKFAAELMGKALSRTGSGNTDMEVAVGEIARVSSSMLQSPVTDPQHRAPAIRTIGPSDELTSGDRPDSPRLGFSETNFRTPAVDLHAMVDPVIGKGASTLARTGSKELLSELAGRSPSGFLRLDSGGIFERKGSTGILRDSPRFRSLPLQRIPAVQHSPVAFSSSPTPRFAAGSGSLGGAAVKKLDSPPTFSLGPTSSPSPLMDQEMKKKSRSLGDYMELSKLFGSPSSQKLERKVASFDEMTMSWTAHESILDPLLSKGCVKAAEHPGLDADMGSDLERAGNAEVRAAAKLREKAVSPDTTSSQGSDDNAHIFLPARPAAGPSSSTSTPCVGIEKVEKVQIQPATQHAQYHTVEKQHQQQHHHQQQQKKEEEAASARETRALAMGHRGSKRLMRRFLAALRSITRRNGACRASELIVAARRGVSIYSSVFLSWKYYANERISEKCKSIEMYAWGEIGDVRGMLRLHAGDVKECLSSLQQASLEQLRESLASLACGIGAANAHDSLDDSVELGISEEMALRLLHDNEGDVSKATAVAAEAFSALHATRHRAARVTKSSVLGWRMVARWERTLQAFSSKLQIVAIRRFVVSFVVAWREFVACVAGLRALGLMAREQLWVSFGRRFMSLWRAGIEFSHKGTLARVMGANERFKRLVKTFFVAWTDLIHWRASLRFISIYSSNIIRAKCQVEYFQAWVEVVEYREIQRSVREGSSAVAACSQLGLLSDVLRDWHCYARTSTLARLGRVMARRHLMQVIRSCIDAWWGVLEKRKEKYIASKINADELMQPDFARSCLESARGDERVASYQARWLLHADKVALIASALDTLSPEYQAKCLAVLSLVSDPSAMLHGTAPPAGPQLGGAGAVSAAATLGGVVWVTVTQAVSWIMLHVHSSEERLSRFYAAWLEVASHSLRMRKWKKACLGARLRPWFDALAYSVMVSVRAEGLNARVQVRSLVRTMKAWHEEATDICQVVYSKANGMGSLKSRFRLSEVLKAWSDACTVYISLRLVSKHIWKIIGQIYSSWFFKGAMKLWGQYKKSRAMGRNVRCRPAMRKWLDAMVLKKLCEKVNVHLTRYSAMKRIRRWRANVEKIQRFKGVETSCLKHAAAAHFREWRSECRLTQFAKESGLRLVGKRLLAWGRVRPRRVECEALVGVERAKGATRTLREVIECWSDFRHGQALILKVVRSAVHSQLSEVVQAWSDRAMIHRMVGFRSALHSTGALHATFLCWARIVRREWNIRLRGIRTRGRLVLRAFHCWYEEMARIKEQREALRARETRFATRVCQEWRARGLHKRRVRQLADSSKNLHDAVCVWTAFDQMRACADEPENARERLVKAMSRRLARLYDHNLAQTAFGGMSRYSRRRAVLRDAEAAWNRQDLTAVWLQEFVRLWLHAVAYCETKRWAKQLGRLADLRRGLHSWSWCTGRIKNLRHAGSRGAELQERLSSKWRISVCTWCVWVFRWYASYQWRKYLASIQRKSRKRKMFYSWREGASLLALRRSLTATYRTDILEIAWYGMVHNAARKHMLITCKIMDQRRSLRFGFKSLMEAVVVAQEHCESAAAIKHMVGGSLVLWAVQCWKSFVDEEWAVKEKEVAARLCIEVSLLQCRELLRASRGSVDDAVSNMDKGLINMVVTSAGIDSPSKVEPDNVLATIEKCKGDIDEAIAQVSEQFMMRAAATFCSSIILTAFTSAWRGRARRDAALRVAVSAFSAKIAVARAQRLVKDAAEWLFALASMKLASKRYAQLRVAKAIPNILSGWLAASRRVKGQRERVQRVEFAMGGHLVRRAWRVWDEFILDRPMKSALLLDVGVLRRKVVGGFLRDVVLCWKRFAGRNFKSYLGSVMLRMHRIRLAFEGWDLASERRWEGDRKHQAALKAHLAAFLEAWHRLCMMRTAVKVYFQPGFKSRFLGFWFSGWAREASLMRCVKRIARGKADREHGEAAGDLFDRWSLNWALERGVKMEEVEAMMTSSRGIKIVQAQPGGILKRFRGDVDAVRAAIVNPQAQALRKLTGSKISEERAVALLSESGGVFTDAEQAAVLEVKGDKAAAFRRGLLLRAWQAYVDGKVVVAVSGARASILLRRGLVRRVFEAARDFAYGRISRRAVAERMGWGAELGIGARKRTLQSWFIARWKYHASVGVSAKRFQEKRVIRAGRNAAVEWRLVADQRPVREAVRRLIVAKQRKRETNFCRDVWGEWRHQVWLSFRVYLGKISARASVVKFSFGAWYTLWCRQVYGPRCMRNAVERLSLYRVLGVWMDEVEEECAWKEEELAKRMLAEDGGMLNMSASSAGMTKSGAIFAVPHTRSGKSASPSRRGSSVCSSLSQNEASNHVLLKHVEASRHLEGQKWMAGAGAEEEFIAGGASRVDGEADVTIGGAGDLSGVDASMLMLQLSELDVSGDAHGHATDSLNISHSVIESTPTDILRASRNSIHDAFRMLDSLQAKALQESVDGPLPTDTALWVLHEAGLFPEAVGMAHEASSYISAGEHRLKTIFREISIASAQRRARGLVGARVAALHAMALVRGGLRSWEGVVWWKKDSARRSIVFSETWRPCREREFFRAWAMVSEEGAWRERVRHGVLRGAGSWAWWELGRYARRRAGMRSGQRAVVEGVHAKIEVVKLELQIRREYSALEAQMLLRGKESLTCNEACPLIGTMIGEADWHVEEANSHFEEAVSFFEQSLGIDERGDGETIGDGDRQQQLAGEAVSAQVSKDESFHEAFSTFLECSDDGNRSTSPLGSTAVAKVSLQSREPSALQTAAAMQHMGSLVIRALASLTLARALNAWEHHVGSEKRLAKLGFELESAHVSLEMQRVFARWYGVLVYRQSLLNAEQSSQVWSANLSMRRALRGWRGVSQRSLHLVKIEDTIGRRRLVALMVAWVSEAAFSKVCKSARITAGRRCLSAALEWWMHALEISRRIRAAEHTWRGGYQQYWLRVAATSLACWKGVSGARNIKVRHAEMTAGGIMAAWGGFAGRKRWFAEIVAGSRQIIEERLLRRVVSSWFDHSSRHLVSWVVVRGGELQRTRTLVMAWRGYVTQKKWRMEVIAGGVAARNAGLVEEAWLTWWVASFKMRHVLHIPGNGEGDDDVQRTEYEEDSQDANEADEEKDGNFFRTSGGE